MKPLIAVTLAAAFAGAAHAATPDGRVQLLAPDAARFKDFRARESDTDAGREGLLARLRRDLDERAAPRLAGGTRLEVTLLDVDMAGEFEPNARGEQVRVVRDLYAPRIELAFRILGSDGRTLCEGRRSLTDPLFIRRTNIADANDALRHEKALLDDWAARDVPCATPRVAEAPGADVPRVQVSFGDLSKFSDLRNSVAPGPGERQGLAGILQRHLEREGAERIPPDTRLRVTITDVDMAGEFRLGASDVRLIKDMYPPRIELDFQLVAPGGSIEKQGHRELRGLAFLTGASPATAESMRFEKELLDDWLKKEFAPAGRAANANR